MRWSPQRWIREAHFASSLLLCLLLAFFAMTGFMAHHREWFHPRLDRDDLAEPVGAAACQAPSLAEAAGAPDGEIERRGRWMLITRSDGAARLACRDDKPGHQLGVVQPWPAGVPAEVDTWRQVWEREHRSWLEPWNPGGGDAGARWFRRADVWRIRTFEVDPSRQRVTAWTLPVPLGMSLIELHRGRGTTSILIDLAAALTLLVAGTGLLHGLRYPGARRRLLVALVVVSAALVGALLLG